MGFIDLSGSLGRQFGSIGVALNEINTRVSLSASESCRVTGVSIPRAEKCLRSLCEALKVSNSIHLHVESAIPDHVGLGSGTQMSLAIGMGLSRFYGLDFSVREIAEITDRGMRSGIGIGVFELGGLVVDGGRGKHTVTPPVLSRMNVPASWRFILAFDQRGQGLHGKQEIQAFKALPQYSQEEAARLCYLLLMQGLPSVAEHDIQKFGDVISQLQLSVGEHFASAQGGVFTSSEVGEAMLWLGQQGAVAIGQTSWGPTGFCAVANENQGIELIELAKQNFAHHKHLSFQLVSVRNTGADVF